MAGTLKALYEWMVLIGAVVWGGVAVGFNIFEMVSNAINLPVIATIIYGVVGISGVILLLQKLKILRK